VFAKNNLNGTTTITFSKPHNLTQYNIFAVVNFSVEVDGYYVVALVVDPNRVIINLELNSAIRDVAGEGIGFKFQSQRVQQPSDIANLPLLSAEFSSNKVWVDESTDGSWAVYRKSINYTPTVDFTKNAAISYGSAVAYTQQAGYIVGDAGLGKVYRSVYNTLTDTYDIKQELSGAASFGSTIVYQDDLFAISQPTGTPEVRLYKFVVINELDIVVNNLALLQVLPAQDGSTNWGTSVAISGDKKWLYISAMDLAKVYVYVLSETTGLYELATSDGITAITLSIPGLIGADNFGRCRRNGVPPSLRAYEGLPLSTQGTRR
jgi:hypothetical protein